MKYALFISFIALCPRIGFATISFQEALDSIESRSTAVGGQQEVFESTKALNVPTHLYLLPTITADAKDAKNGSVASIPTATAKQVEATANLNVFKFGADYELSKAASKDEDQQNKLIGSAIIQVEDQGVRALIGLIQRKLELDVYNRQLEARQDTLDVAQARYKRGLLAEQEVRKVYIDEENARSHVEEGKLLVYDAEAAVVNLLGSSAIEAAWPWKSFFSGWDPEAFANSKELKLEDRPDWVAALAHVESQQIRTARDYRLMLPSLDASFIYGTYEYDYTGYGANGPAWQAAATITLPIFDRLTNLSNARSDAALARQAELEKAAIERDAESQFEAAKKGLIESVRSAVKREASLATAVLLYKDSLKRFQNGRSDSNELLIDQGRVLDTELLAISGWSEAHIALARYCHVLGKKISSCAPIR